MSAPVDLDAIEPPPWLGDALSGRPGASTDGSDNVAVGADTAGLAADMAELGDAAGELLNGVGGAGTAYSVYHQSFVQGQERWEKALRVFEAAVAAYADVQLGNFNPVLPVADAALSRATGGAISLAGTISATVSTGAVLVVNAKTGRHEELAKLRMRAEMGKMGLAAQKAAEAIGWLSRKLAGG